MVRRSPTGQHFNRKGSDDKQKPGDLDNLYNTQKIDIQSMQDHGDTVSQGVKSSQFAYMQTDMQSESTYAPSHNFKPSIKVGQLNPTA